MTSDALALPAVRLAPGGCTGTERIVPVETPVAISFCGIGYAVMMATPSDLEDFACGFALSERLISSFADIVEVDIRPAATGILLNVELAPDRRPVVFERVRHRTGDSSCGLCGIENLDQALQPLPALSAPEPVAAAVLFGALETLRDHQPLNARTGAVHAAALFEADGALVAAREDVGRHNAFDKLIGHALRTKLPLDRGFALLSSRCSYELVEKAALAGIRLLVTISAPTSLAVERAQAAKLTLIALARPDSMLVVSDPHGLWPAHSTQSSPISR